MNRRSWLQGIVASVAGTALTIDAKSADSAAQAPLVELYQPGDVVTAVKQTQAIAKGIDTSAIYMVDEEGHYHALGWVRRLATVAEVGALIRMDLEVLVNPDSDAMVYAHNLIGGGPRLNVGQFQGEWETFYRG
jgi:hypothetical protein